MLASPCLLKDVLPLELFIEYGGLVADWDVTVDSSFKSYHRTSL